VDEVARPQTGPFRRQVLVRFGDCDPAGIVFYPDTLRCLTIWWKIGIARRCSFLSRKLSPPGAGDFRPSILRLISLLPPLQRGIVSKPFSAGDRHQFCESGHPAARPDGADRVRGKVVLVWIDRRVTQTIRFRTKYALDYWHFEFRMNQQPSRLRGEEQNMKCLHPAHWPRPKGYSNGVVANGRTIFISGMIGWDAQGKMVSRDFVGQVRQILRNIVEVLSEANAKPGNIVRMNWYVLDKKEYVDSYKQLGIVYREIFGGHYPAMTAVQVSSLIEDAARVEIEVTAVIPD